MSYSQTSHVEQWRSVRPGVERWSASDSNCSPCPVEEIVAVIKPYKVPRLRKVRSLPINVRRKLIGIIIYAKQVLEAYFRSETCVRCYCIGARQTLRVHSHQVAALMHEMTSWPPSWKWTKSPGQNYSGLNPCEFTSRKFLSNFIQIRFETTGVVGFLKDGRLQEEEDDEEDDDDDDDERCEISSWAKMFSTLSTSSRVVIEQK